jgi:hypothetical protein
MLQSRHEEHNKGHFYSMTWCRGMQNILGEDREILETLRPEEVMSELSLKADAPQLELRAMRAVYIRAGSAVHPGPRPLGSLPKWQDTLIQSE